MWSLNAHRVASFGQSVLSHVCPTIGHFGQIRATVAVNQERAEFEAETGFPRRTVFITKNGEFRCLRAGWLLTRAPLRKSRTRGTPRSQLRA
jgi:hypothetical protein